MPVTGVPPVRTPVRPSRLREGRCGELLGRSAAPGAGEGAVEVPSARVAVVHDAGRLDSAPVTFLVTAVKVV
ncbi:hypothetical protein F7R91_08400 [Streptomyces luteolifulvus]|uniref:Uncharacterized protein n=1 Tax=Streptomyces luteolifulvus TaxID=2615112 RepID=A0A6H9V6V5_9ACTN|nr:hypothetical protein F7R91_08400 [Streptomyces luteolifulvus]